MSDVIQEAAPVFSPSVGGPDMGALYGALAEARLEFGEIIKNKTARISGDKGNYTYKYADLADVLKATSPFLAAHGLHFVQEPEITYVNGKLTVVIHGSIKHKSGAVLNLRPLDMPVSGFTPQAIGGAISFGRRYQMSAVLNVASDDDDDGQAAGAGIDNGYEQRGDQRNGAGSATRTTVQRQSAPPTASTQRQSPPPPQQAATKPQATTTPATQPEPVDEEEVDDPDANGTPAHDRCFGIGKGVFGDDWSRGARSWLIGKWTLRTKSLVRDSMALLSDDEKDQLGDYMNDNRAKLHELWEAEKKKREAASQQGAAVAAGFAA
jgi:hypothetical protein